MQQGKGVSGKSVKLLWKQAQRNIKTMSPVLNLEWNRNRRNVIDCINKDRQAYDKLP